MNLFEACKKYINKDVVLKHVGGIQKMEIGPPIALVFCINTFKFVIPWGVISEIAHFSDNEQSSVTIFTNTDKTSYEVKKEVNPDSYQKLVEFIEWMENPILIHPTSTIKT